jgi:hypothetical protein
MKQILLLLLAFVCINAKAATVEPVITMTTAFNIGETIEFTLAVKANSAVVKIDFGDGTLINKTVYYNASTITGTVAGSRIIKIYGTDITQLYCNDQQLTSLDVTKSIALTHLKCMSNQLISIDLTKNIALQELLCNSNQLTSLDLTMNKALTLLKCEFNQISSLDVTFNTALIRLICDSNQLTTLDVTKNIALKELWCMSNKLISLDVTNNLALIELGCSNNRLTSLDVTKNTALIRLWCNTNILTSLDVTMNKALLYFECMHNQLTSLDVIQNMVLEQLYCSDNQLAFLNASNNTALEDLICSYNKLTFTSLHLMYQRNYNYSPQDPISIPTSVIINTPIDLSSQLTVNGNTTTYIWKSESGSLLTAGTDYTITNGITTFTTIPAEKVYCEMTNATFPNFAGADVLKTTLTSITTSTAIDANNANAVSIYTLNQTVTISLPQAADVKVYDITGNMIKVAHYNSGSNSFEVAQKGVYMITVNMNNRVVSTKVVVK